MKYGYHEAKGIRATDARKGIRMDKRPEGPVKTMGHPCDLDLDTKAIKLGAKKAVPTAYEPVMEGFGFPKTRIY